MPHRVFVASSLAALALAFAGTARAQEACGDTTCPKGWECETEAAPCPAIDCGDGEDCPVCEPTMVEACRPGPCTSDADCDPAMRCFTEQHSVCNGGGAAPCAAPDGGEPCPEPEPVNCTLETVSACLPTYLGPCQTASDCGDGFRCEAEEECSCTGSSGGSAGSGGARPTPEATPDGGDAFVPADAGADPVPPDECVCEPTGTNHCVAVKTACTPETVAADCPSGWTCETNPEGVCSSGPDGTSCTPADPPELCLPPFSDLGGGVKGGGEDGGEPTGGAMDGGVIISVDAGTEPPTSGAAGRSGNGAAENGDEPMSSESGGCSVTRPAGSSTGALVGFLLGALGLALARRRR